jgi:hypothetical protein
LIFRPEDIPGGLVKMTNDPSNAHWMREANFTLSGTGSWNNTNDWSFAGIAPLSADFLVKTAQIPVYSNGKLIFGAEPPARGGRVAYEAKADGAEGFALYPNPASNKLTVSYYSSSSQTVKSSCAMACQCRSRARRRRRWPAGIRWS